MGSASQPPSATPATIVAMAPRRPAHDHDHDEICAWLLIRAIESRQV
jgi:hypothetical protein